MKKLLSTIIALCMLISAFPFSVSAADLVTKVVLTIEEPQVGEAPAVTASLPANASTEVLSVKWSPTDAAFKATADYTVSIEVGIKADVKRTFADVYKINATVNGENAKEIKNSSKKITVEYTWKAASETEIATALKAAKSAIDNLNITNSISDDYVIAAVKEALPAGGEVTKVGNAYKKAATETEKGRYFIELKITLPNGETDSFQYAKDIPVLEGSSDTTANPNNSVSTNTSTDTNTNTNTADANKNNTSSDASNNADKTTKVSFVDVKAGAYYEASVKWAVDKSITSGTSATTFSPEDTCTRAQILTFLWRAMGSPKSSSSNAFADIKSSDYYYDAALWSRKNGMVVGGTFDGNTPCTRAYTVIYLWKNAGSPSAAVNNTFSDVSASADYAQAVAWAVENGVTSGTSATTFSPNDTCTRGQIVTFLNRALSAETKTTAQVTTEKKTTKSENITEPTKTTEPVKTAEPVQPAETTKTSETTKPTTTATPTEAAKNEKETTEQQAVANPLRPEYDKQVYEKAVDEFLTAALGKSHGEGMTDLQKALALHDHLVLNCQYDLTKARKYAHSEYGALVEGLAVCEGYTLAYNDLLSRVGIKAEYVRGRLKSCGDPHAWSGVTIDGKNYHVDVTNDDSTPDAKGSVSHNFFMLSDYDMSLHSDYTYHCSDRTYEKGYLFNYSGTAFFWDDNIKKFYYLDMDKVKTTSALNEKMTPESEKNGFQPDKSVMSADGKYICFFRINGATDQYPLYLYCMETDEYYKHLITGIKNVIGCGMRQTGNNIEVITDLYNKSVPVAPKIKATVSLPTDTEKHTVTLDTNYTGGETKVCNYLNDDWASTTIFSNPPKRSGYTFNGWYTEKDGGTKIDALTELKDSNTTLYAHWLGA